MTIRPFDYIEANDLARVTSTLAEAGSEAVLLAGGTDLLIMLKHGTIRPRLVINIKGISALSGIHNDKGQVHIGPLTKLRELETSALIRDKLPALQEAASRLGSLQIRQIATVGGNLCRAAPCAETAPPLLIYDSRVHIAGPDGERTVPLDEYFTGPGEIVLTRGEVLKEIEIPALPAQAGGAYLRHSVRQVMDLALVNVAAYLLLEEDGETIAEARIALGSVAPTPMRARRAEQALRGETVSADLFVEAGRLAAEESKPISDVRSSDDYRRTITEEFTRRVLDQALTRCKGRISSV